MFYSELGHVFHSRFYVSELGLHGAGQRVIAPAVPNGNKHCPVGKEHVLYAHAVQALQALCRA
jgi:hypothetical protein